MDEKLKPDTFVKINAPMDTGSAIAAKDGADYKSIMVVRAAGDKVLTIGFAGTVKVYNKSDCVAVPLVPTVKTGDKVKAVFSGTYKDAEVIKVDPKIGRVWVKFDFIKDKEYVLAFGEVTPKL